MIERIRYNFWWPKMDQQIIDYIRSYLECQKDKAARNKPYGLLSPLEHPYAPWTSITMDFITDLPLSEDCDQLWVIVDRFTKMAHFIPLHKDQKKAEHLVKIFAREIWRFHGIPTDIISDRDSRFTSTEWKQFRGIPRIRPRMSTSFHPQTDGQIERINQTIEAYLRSFINYEMDNWVGLLPMAEFAYNNSITQATGISPFYANYG
jgi:transposase InsO family protein